MTASTGISQQGLEELAVNTIRVLSAEAVQAANSGHPGLPMGCADLAYVLFTKHLKFDPKAAEWPDRDRFVLSAGHGSMLLYSMLHLCGYDLPLDELRRFRQLGSATPGHPEHGDTVGVETTTGPLGQGFANAVGMALAESLLAARYNTSKHTIVDHHTYALASDGDLMEGISHEAASLAGHLRLGKLVVLYDDNLISLDGPTDLSFSENVEQRFESYGWHTVRAAGHNRDEVDAAIQAARDETGRPTLIICRTIIGKGSPNKAGTNGVHGAALGPDELAATRKALDWEYPAFTVPDEVRPLFQQGGAAGSKVRADWESTFTQWKTANPDLAKLWARTAARELPEGWEADLPTFSPGDKALATRAASGKVINAIAARVPELIGGSADLKSSNNTEVQGGDAVSADNFGARNLWFGVREHAMGAAMNGLSLHGHIRPYGATFLTFSDYVRPAIRLGALMKQPVVYVFTHDSVFLGEDGPTHQPIEHIAALRTIPNVWVIRPADANETAAAWRITLQRTDGPTALILTRQGLPILDDAAVGRDTERGAYVLESASDADPQLLLLATGSEVSTTCEAAKLLRADGIRIRVVNIPCWELFDQQNQSYKDEVLPPNVTKRLAVEAASPFGWERFVGIEGAIQGIDTFGASAPLKELAEKFGFTPEAIAAKARDLL